MPRSSPIRLSFDLIIVTRLFLVVRTSVRDSTAFLIVLMIVFH